MMGPIESPEGLTNKTLKLEGYSVPVAIKRLVLTNLSPKKIMDRKT